MLKIYYCSFQHHFHFVQVIVLRHLLFELQHFNVDVL